MRILFAADVEPDWNSGAAGTELHTIRELRELGHEVDEIWRRDLPHRIRHGNLHYLLELPRGYRAAIASRCARRSYDAIHVNQGHAYLAAKDHRVSKRGAVFVVRSHGLDDHMESVLRPWRKRLGIRGRSIVKSVPGRAIDALLDRHMRLAVRYGDGFIVSSSSDRHYLIERHGMSPDRIACIAQAAPDSYISSEPVPMTPERLRRILYVSGFAYFKGPDTVADVANELLTENADVKFTWVCSAKDHGRVRALLRPGVARRVQLLDWLPQDKLKSVYDSHGIFVYPPLFDGFGKVFLEAMSRGLCVIATRTGGMLDIIQDGSSGFLIDLDDPRTRMTERIQWLVANPKKARRMSSIAHDTACQYSWERVGRNTVAFYQHLLGIASVT